MWDGMEAQGTRAAKRCRVQESIAFLHKSCSKTLSMPQFVLVTLQVQQIQEKIKLTSYNESQRCQCCKKI